MIMKSKVIELSNLINDWKHANILIKNLERDRAEYRQFILHIMKETEQKSFECEFGTTKVTYPKTFDQPMMLFEEPKEVTNRFWESVTTTTDIFNKKEFKKTHPELWDKYQIDLTPRLTIK